MSTECINIRWSQKGLRKLSIYSVSDLRRKMDDEENHTVCDFHELFLRPR